MKRILSTFNFTDMTLFYIIDEENHVEMMLVPSDMVDLIEWEKEGNIDSLVQLMIDGDAAPYGFANGHTLRNSQSTAELIYVKQDVIKDKDSTIVVSTLKNQSDLFFYHQMRYAEGEKGITVKTTVDNKASEETTINMLSSFSLGTLTPFEQGEATEALLIHRIRSKWSTEGRVETRTAEELLLEPTWSRHGAYSEKFGQIGSMPVRKFFPFLAVEDKKNQVIWAAQLCCSSSWQLEIYRRDENLCISGGIADYDFGHWCKKLQPDESFDTPEVYLTVSREDFDSTCQRLTKMQETPEISQKFSKSLPVIFNEFCTTWGEPSHDKVNGLLQAIGDKGFDYFVIDAGWHADLKKGWENNMGDWNVSESLFPYGLDATVKEIKAAGLKPGLWFEAEVVGQDSYALQLHKEHLLTKNDKLIKSGSRYFWDMRDPWTQNYLSEKIIDLLKKYQFEYIKIDYNESIGIGCDGAESFGQGLFENIEATKSFFKKIRSEIPGIVIEICSSGGHRSEPAMISLGEMVSFSDAHEQIEIPIIAANMHRVILPKKSQIWAVMQKEDSLQRICYSISSTFLGAMCISGDVNNLSEQQWNMVSKGISFYRKISSMIQNGVTEFYGTKQESYRVLKGWQGILRKEIAESKAYLVVHSFEAIEEITIPIKAECEILETYESSEHQVTKDGQKLVLKNMSAYEAVVLLLRI